MDCHCCFKVYIIRTRATRIYDTVFFKHQYITNPKVSPKTMVILAAQRLASALQGNVAPETKAADVLRRVSKLFMMIVVAKASAAKAKEQQNRLRNHPEACHTTPFPRVAEPNPRVAEPNPRVEISLPRVTAVLEAVASPPKQWQVAQAPCNTLHSYQGKTSSHLWQGPTTSHKT
jgi:hypothetical protein